MQNTRMTEVKKEVRITSPYPSNTHDDKNLSPEQHKTLITTIRNALYNRYKDQGKYVGSKHSNKGTGKKEISCISYVSDCIAEGYEAIHNPGVAAQVRKISDGTAMAKFLQKRGWGVKYYNADTSDHLEGNEGKVSWGQVKKTGRYHTGSERENVPVDGSWLDYGIDSPGYSQEKTDEIAREDIGIVSAFGGYHTGLLMNGAVYEAHWLQEGHDAYPDGTREQDKVLGREDFNKWNQEKGNKKKSGLVILPPRPASPEE